MPRVIICDNLDDVYRDRSSAIARWGQDAKANSGGRSDPTDMSETLATDRAAIRLVFSVPALKFCSVIKWIRKQPFKL